MKGIILAGGHGSRLYPVTRVVCKQLLPLYDKPMVYYPLSVLMLADIRDILLISAPQDLPRFKELLGDGRQLGLSLSYAVQDKPRGIADALRVGEKFIGPDALCLILGDNVFYGHGLPQLLKSAAAQKEGATIFGYAVKDPQRYGVVELDSQGRPLSIVEKPAKPCSNYAVVGIYFYDNQAVTMAKSLKPSARGELEITDINRMYLDRKKLSVKIMGRGFAWLDTGTPEAMADATVFFKTVEERQGLKIACLEEIAFKSGWIDRTQLRRLAEAQKPSSYSDYLLQVIADSQG